MINDKGHIVQRRWLFINKAVLLAAVTVTVAQWFRPTISSTVADLLFIITFVMYLASEKIEGRALPIHEKALCYFVTYVLGFFIMERQLHQLIRKPEMTYVVLSVALCLTVLMAYQMRYFRRQTKDKTVASLVLVFGFLAIACASYVPASYLFK